MSNTTFVLGAAVLGVAVLAPSAFAEEILGVTSDDALIAFDSAHPEAVLRSRQITGVDSLVTSIAVRPADGQLFAMTDSHRLYRIDRSTGIGTPIGANPIVPALVGHAAISFDPGRDEIRVVTSSGQNLRVDPVDATVTDTDPNTAGVQPDHPLVYAGDDVAAGFTPGAAAVAHTSGFPNGTNTCFVIDAALDVLARLGDADASADSRNAGVLRTVGALGVDASATGFDVSRATGRAYLAVTIPGEQTSRLYSVSLFTGAATLVGQVGSPRPLTTIVVDSTATSSGGRSVEMVALTQSGALVRFRTDAPGVMTNRIAVTGLVEGDALVAVATRPSNGRLYGLSRAGRLYVINALTGVARVVRSTPFEVALDGARFGFDFSPTTAVARVVSETGQNFRVMADTGAVIDGDPSTPGVQPDSPLAFAVGDPYAGPRPTLVASAFARTQAGTTLFGIDANFDTLVRQGTTSGPSPSNGVLRTVGALDIDASGAVGFEIVDGATAFATFANAGGMPSLWSIDLRTGAATSLGVVGSDEAVVSVAAAPTSNPATFGDALRVATMAMRFDFRRVDGDSIVMTGSMPFPDAGRAGRHVVVDVGGFQKTFDLNAKGAALDRAGTRSTGDDDSFKFVGAPSDGRIRFGCAIRREHVADDLADEGMGGDASFRGATRVVRVTITVDGVAYASDVTLRYTARAGVVGAAVIKP